MRLVMPNRNKRRGYELEFETKEFWKQSGFKCTRSFASGAYKHALGKAHEGDLHLEEFTVECKRKKTGFKFLYKALKQDDADILVVREDRQPRLYLLSETTLLRLMKKAYDI